MKSIYQRALGADFERLHPQIQRRFGLCSGNRVAAVGRGVMEEVWKGRPYTVPFLYDGTWRRIMFPETGQNIPFTIENYAFVDGFGRETVTWVRTFESRRQRRFDAYMIYSEARGCIVDYLGSHQHLAVDIELSVDAEGGLRLEQCFRILVDVRNKTWGRLFGYRGRFEVDWQTLESSRLPTHVLPLRQERRE